MEVTLRLFSTRVVPEIEAISGPGTAEIKGHLIRVILELICADDVREATNWAKSSICKWYREQPEWKSSFEQRMQQLVGVMSFSRSKIRL